MANVKLVVAYPRPEDCDAFEKVYQEEHVPLAVAKLSGKNKIVATKILGCPQGTPPFYRIAEVYFPSMQVLEECVASDGCKEALAQRSEDLFRWDTNFLGSRGGDSHVRSNSKRLVRGEARCVSGFQLLYFLQFPS